MLEQHLLLVTHLAEVIQGMEAALGEMEAIVMHPLVAVVAAVQADIVVLVAQVLILQSKLVHQELVVAVVVVPLDLVLLIKQVVAVALEFLVKVQTARVVQVKL